MDPIYADPRWQAPTPRKYLPQYQLDPQVGPHSTNLNSQYQPAIHRSLTRAETRE